MISWGGWTLDDRIVNSTPPTRLSKAEAAIFGLLIRAQGMEITHQQIIASLGMSRNYARHVVTTIRRDLGHDVISNIRSVGYRLRKREVTAPGVLIAEIVNQLETALTAARKLEYMLDNR